MCIPIKYELGLMIIVLGLEYWLGKTEKTKAGSTLELVYNLLKLFVKIK